MSHTELIEHVPVVGQPPDRLVEFVSRHGVLVILVGLIAVDLVLQPSLASVFQAGLLLQGAMTLVLVAAAQTLVVMTGGLDLSVAGNLALANVLTATWSVSPAGRPLLWPMAGILLIGVVTGTVTGSLVAVLKVPSFVATLATWAILNGVALLVMPTPGGTVSPRLTALLNGHLLGVPAAVLLLVVILAVWSVYSTSPAGLHLRAVGADAARAALNGIRTNRVIIGAYAGSGVLACAAGVYLAGITAGGDPTIGDQYVLPSIAAVVVGGTWFGGQGGVGRSAVGALTIVMMADVVGALTLPPNIAIVASSTLLLIVVVTRQVAERRMGAST